MTLNSEVIQEKDYEKYLGDYLHNKGAEDSVKQTVTDRYWRAYSAILEVKTIVEDCRSHKVGGHLLGIDIWELAILPMLLNNSGSWDVISVIPTRN